jgi:hypothetical protein
LRQSHWSFWVAVQSCPEELLIALFLKKFDLTFTEMSMIRSYKLAVLVALFGLLALAFGDEAAKKPAAEKAVTVKGYVLDSACAFTKGLKKPISSECATACAKGGSPLVILTPAGEIYWPISGDTPSTEQNSRLLPFAGQKVTATGKVFKRGGSEALVIDHVEAQVAAK